MSVVPAPGPSGPPAAPAAQVSATPDAVRVVRKLLWMPILLAILGAIVGYLLTSGREYTARTLLKVGPDNLDQLVLGVAPETSTNTNLVVAETIANIDQLGTARKTQGLLAGQPDLTPTEIDDKVSVSVDPRTFLVAVDATDRSPIIAAKLSRLYVLAYVQLVTSEQRGRLTAIEAQLTKRLAEIRQDRDEALVGLPESQREITRRALLIQPTAEETQILAKLGSIEIFKQAGPQNVSVAREPDIPTSPSGLPPLLFMLVGLVAGGLLGTALAFLIAGRDPKVRAEETAEGLLAAPIVVRAPASLASRERASTPFSALRPVEAESARIAAAQLRLSPASRDARAIAIVAADDDTIGSPVALAVAGALARTPFTVLLISIGAEESWPAVGRLLDGAPDGAGALEEEDGGDGILHRLALGEEELRDDRVAAVRTWALQRYDRVVLASPTPDRHSAGVVLLRAADTALAVASAGETSRVSLARLRDLASQIGVPIAGIVATGFGSAEA